MLKWKDHSDPLYTLRHRATLGDWTLLLTADRDPVHRRYWWFRVYDTGSEVYGTRIRIRSETPPIERAEKLLRSVVDKLRHRAADRYHRLTEALDG